MNPISKVGARFLIIRWAGVALLLITWMAVSPRAAAQTVLFDFDNAPLQSPFPITQTVGGITARFAGTGQSYSIQNANTMGFTPQGFAGRCIYPSSVFLADLLIRFDQPLTDFSILYSCQELGCDDAATMRVTAFLNGSLVGTNTQTAAFPGTWPTDTLKCSFLTGFDSVVVHYDSHPPTCQDYGVIFLADNMKVIPQHGSAVSSSQTLQAASLQPNPMSETAILSYTLASPEDVQISMHDLSGRMILQLWNGPQGAGSHRLLLRLDDDLVEDGEYFLHITGTDFSKSLKVLVIHR